VVFLGFLSRELIASCYSILCLSSSFLDFSTSAFFSSTVTITAALSASSLVSSAVILATSAAASVLAVVSVAVASVIEATRAVYFSASTVTPPSMVVTVTSFLSFSS